LKMELLRLQGGLCLYKGTPLVETSLDEYEIDHIVPRSQGGPDAAVNYILTTKTANKEKNNRTPFVWLSPTDGWDAYVGRVKSRQTALRNKKVRLLLLPEAAELADKYTALAETAWIAKLAQTLASLHFGWKNGNDEQGKKRVTVISGGLTARIRRKYKLNNLLAGEGVSEEDAEKKNRDDDRHHALEAMVLAFIPGWARNDSKQKWFRFPSPVDANPPGFFAAQLAKVQPSNEHLSSPRLEATAYGERVIKGATFAVGRERLLSLLLKEANGKESLKPVDKAETHRIVDKAIRKDVESLLASKPALTIEEWKRWCAGYRIGGHGPKVIKALMTKTKPNATDEYRDLSKDGTRQLRRGEMHRGYFVYWVPAPSKKEPEKKRAVVRPVYAFQSEAIIQRELRSQGVMDGQFFESGCTVELSGSVEHPKTPLAAGRYLLNSIWEQGNVVVTGNTGKVSAPIGLAHMLRAGLRRYES
jgi:CRISPR-associated endonuclease Csn1